MAHTLSGSTPHHDMEFIGKWSFAQATMIIQIDTTSGVLTVGASRADGMSNFNAYGTAAGFVLQASNGLYVVSTGDGYAATKSVTDALNIFTLVTNGSGGAEILDLGLNGTGTTQYIWNVVGNLIKPLARTNTPPDSAVFTQDIITPGLAEILRDGFDSSKPDLTWVDLSGTDFNAATTNLDFTQCQLSHANLSKTKFPPFTGFDKSYAPFVSFAGAVLASCSIGSANCTNSDFSGANLDQAQVDSTDFSHANLKLATLRGAVNLANAKFISADCCGVNFSNTGNIYNTDFTGANLSDAIFTGASVTGKMTIIDADLSGAALNNPNGQVTIFPNKIVLNTKTNFTRALLQYIDFSGYQLSNVLFSGADMTGCKLDKTTLIGTDLSYTKLDNATFTGTVQLNGANLSNASMQGANLTNAQLGALSSLFSVTSENTNYNIFLDGLQTDNNAEVQRIFSANGYTLAGTVTISQSRFTETTWTVQATGPTPQFYTVIQQKIGGEETLVVYQPTTPAVLANAFMVNVNLTGTNLIGINASGASIYGIGGNKPNLNSALLQDAQFSNANLSNADFSSANLGGVNFDYAVITNGIFQNAQLTTSSSGTRASFVGSNLQNTNFDGAMINNVVFTNAAVSVANPASPSLSAGVWLFAIPIEVQSLILPELQAATNGQFNLTNQALQQMQTPGPVGPGIVKSFQAEGITLTPGAVLSIMGEGIYWQVTDGSTKYVIFETYDPSQYMPALGVSNGTTYTTTALFYLPLSLEPNLKNGPVNSAVVDAFAAHGHPISSTSQITIAQHPTDWQIINGPPSYTVYSLWLEVVPSTGLAITIRPAIPNLISAFSAVSIALSTRATVTTLSSKNGWVVSNDSENPYNPVINYITFNIVQTDVSKPIDVYGGVMRIARASSSEQLQYFNIAPGITSLTQSQLSAPGNVCPNGEFATTNQINNLTYNEWLRARVTPHPPRCIPDPGGMFFCPK